MAAPPLAAHRAPALAAAAAAALILPGCSGGTGPGGGGGDASVTVTPSSTTLVAVDATRDLSGSGTDADGNALSEEELSWSSTDGSVATVDGSGVVTARGEGSAMVVASFGGAADTAEITVDQEAAEVTVAPASASVDAPDDTTRFTASAIDANGHAVADASFTWSSTDASVATVDGTGLATARDSGAARIVATAASGAADSADLVVGEDDGGGAGDPVIESVSPDTLREGAAATLRGRDFAGTLAGNVVLMDGVEATVTAASETELQVTVPQYDCRPLRSVAVRVVADGDSSAAADAVLGPDEAALELAAGERAVIPHPSADFCLQIEAGTADREYLVGIQSAARSVGPTGVVLSAETGAAAAGASVPAAGPPAAGDRPEEGPGEAPAGPGPSRPAAGSGPRAVADLPEGAWRRHYRAESRIRRWEAEHLPSLAGPERAGPGARDAGPPVARTHGPGGESSVPGSVTEGDTVRLRVPDIAASDLCGTYDSIRAVVRKIGDHGIWVEDVANPPSGYSDGDWTELSDRFDDLVFPTDSAYFGSPTDRDSNGRVVMVVTKEVNEANGVLGFVFGGDLFDRLTSGGAENCASSDEGELTYLLAPDPGGVHGSPWTVSQLKEDNPRLVAHEFTHMIQFGVRLNCSGCTFMPAFVSEGQAVVAEEVNGHAETARSTGSDYGSAVAWDDDGSDPRAWYDNRFIDLARYYGWGGGSVHHASAPEACSWLARDWAGVCDGLRGVYGVPSSIMRWMADHFGPSHPGGEAGFFRDMTASTATGYENWESLTGLTIKEILAAWGASLWTDGRVTTSDPFLTLPSWNLYDIFQTRIPSARLQPDIRGFTDFSVSVGVNAGSAAYTLIAGSSRPHLALKARAPDGGTVAGHMQLWVVRTR